jgi:hypothetical protein
MLEAARSFFRPEFLNRLDDIVTFEPLADHQLISITRLLAEELNVRLQPKNITLTVSDAALRLAVEQAYDPSYGARPLRRWLVRLHYMFWIYLSCKGYHDCSLRNPRCSCLLLNLCSCLSWSMCALSFFIPCDVGKTHHDGPESHDGDGDPDRELECLL